MSTYGKAVPAGLAPHGLGKPVAESTGRSGWLGCCRQDLAHPALLRPSTRVFSLIGTGRVFFLF